MYVHIYFWKYLKNHSKFRLFFPREVVQNFDKLYLPLYVVKSLAQIPSKAILKFSCFP